MTRKRFITDCHERFKKATFRIVSNTETKSVFLEIKKDDATEWTTCLEQKGGAIDYHVHTYLASGVTNLTESKPTARAVIIDAI